ncbi:pentatricopeptide repeat-containing protein At1g26460, mitochondrial-like [Silene latifolia]|uniref:pentatricopeptide repeat-containing protein At1g26460, mitochondrial-like n=1 Tax=Silene latifolia TaxID=37657 RepID=UPI003D770328
MQSKMATLTKTLTQMKTLNPHFVKSISTFSILNQQAVVEDQLPNPPSSLPPNPSTGSPMYNQNWRSPFPSSSSATSAGYTIMSPRIHVWPPPSIDLNSLLNQFADWVTSQEWSDVKAVFDQWINSLDVNGKPNSPNVELFNQYLRSHLMSGTSAAELLEIVERMELFAIKPNTASFNLVIKSIHHTDWKAAVALLERMLQSGKLSQPDDQSFDMVIVKLFQVNQFEAALKYVDLTLKSDYILSSRVFIDSVRSCISMQRLDSLLSIIEKCKAMDQNKLLSPDWSLCNVIAEVAMRNDHSKLVFLTLGFMARWIQRGENTRPPAYLSVDEGLVVKALSTAARTYDTKLLDASWAILKRSLREKKIPNRETYLAKINALASVGNLPSAFSTLSEFEKNHATAEEDVFSPFTSLHPLVMACSKKGYETLDLVYYQLENLSRADPPYKSVAALNCVVLGCANTWDLDRAYQTFEAISSGFGLTPNIHSYNALMYAFGKLRKAEEAARVFEHLSSLGMKSNAKSYTLLVDAHLVNRDPKSALSVLEAMIEAGFEPTRATLLKARRRCQREMDHESDNLVESIARKCKINLGSEKRRHLLFNMEYSTEFAS